MRIRTRSLVIMVNQALVHSTTVLQGIILVRLVTQEQLGTFRQVFLAYAFVSGVLSLQIRHSLYYFLPKLGEAGRKTLLVQSMLASLAGAGLIGLALLLGADLIAAHWHNPALAPLLRILALYPVFEQLVQLLPPFFISLDRPVRAGVYSLIGVSCNVLLVVALLGVRQDLPLTILALVLLQGALALVGGLDMYRHSRGGPLVLSFRQFVAQLEYAWPLWATALVGILNAQLDKIVISQFFSPALYAIYSCGAIELPVVALFTSSLAAAMMPRLVTLADGGNVPAAVELWQAAARKSALLIFPCFLFFLVVAQDLMILLYGASYALAAWPFAIYLGILPVRVAVYATLFRALGRTRPIAVAAGVALVANVGLSFGITALGGATLLGFVGPSLGAWGATMAATVYLLLALCRTTGQRFRQVMRWRELGTIMALGLPGAALAWAAGLLPLPLVLRLSVQGLVFAGGLAAAFLGTGFLLPDERELVALPRRWLRRRAGGG